MSLLSSAVAPARRNDASRARRKSSGEGFRDKEERKRSVRLVPRAAQAEPAPLRPRHPFVGIALVQAGRTAGAPVLLFWIRPKRRRMFWTGPALRFRPGARKPPTRDAREARSLRRTEFRVRGQTLAPAGGTIAWARSTLGRDRAGIQLGLPVHRLDSESNPARARRHHGSHSGLRTGRGAAGNMEVLVGEAGG
jgi:hypothetical protein